MATNEDEVDQLTKDLMKALGDAADETDSSPGDESTSKKESGLGNCATCQQAIEREAAVVGSTRYHPDCFCCEKCRQPFGSEQFYIINGKNYCSKDRDSFLEKCSRCSQPIDGDLIRPKETGKAYHPDCFTCDNCRRRIDGKYFDLDGKTICEQDYRASREKCYKCSEPVMGTVLKALERTYHPSCFTCSQCPLCLDGIQFFLTEEKDPLCETCYSRIAAKKCDGCQEPIVEDCLVSNTTGNYFHKKCYNTRA